VNDFAVRLRYFSKGHNGGVIYFYEVPAVLIVVPREQK
jgi:hypothetical protein